MGRHKPGDFEMTKLLLSLFCVMGLAVACTSISPNSPLPAPSGTRLSESFDPDWRFFIAAPPGADQPAFDDTAWRKLDLPHDWSIEGSFAKSNPTGGPGAFLPSGIAWYRKHFSLPEHLAGRRVFIQFDGVMANSDVWINGFQLGHRPYGYVGFEYELSGHLNFGSGDNVLAVRTDTLAQPASRYYSGAGIYRHVRLVVTDPIHIPEWGIFVTVPQVSSKQATTHIQCTITNQSAAPREISLQTSLFDPAGKEAATASTAARVLAPGNSVHFDQDILVSKPQLWDLDQPVLYHARVTVRSSGTALDQDTACFGIRDARFEAATGFWLNGKNLKIKGVCLHQDASAFGIAVPNAVWRQRLQALRNLGANAIRVSHNPPDPAFLDLCDQMGFLVMDEMFDCWTVGKTAYDYHIYFNEWSLIDTRDTVRRDRNHPSIILYSAGNEIHDTSNAGLSNKILAGLVRTFHENDPSRPVTQALFRPNVSHDYTDGLADLLDVIGTNYRDNELLAAHREKPSRKIIGTENHHDRAAWLAVRNNPAYSGQFLWSGIDYLGESRRWPMVGARAGLVDVTGAPKPMADERRSWWSDQPMVAIARRTAATAPAPGDPGYGLPQQEELSRLQVLWDDWSPANTAPHQENVEVYSNCKEVELFLNGKSLGSKPLNSDATPRNWKVAFEPGTLLAIAKSDGKIVATNQLRTAGPPAKIELVPNVSKLAADWEDAGRVAVTVVDASGVPVPLANDLIHFTISGPGLIAAVDSADNSEHESYQASERRAYHGSCVAFVKAIASSGNITLTASAPGLASASITLKAVKPPPQ
jgi:beta-galactosidase